jgi:hypothetical protein
VCLPLSSMASPTARCSHAHMQDVLQDRTFGAVVAAGRGLGLQRWRLLGGALWLPSCPAEAEARQPRPLQRCHPALWAELTLR